MIAQIQFTSLRFFSSNTLQYMMVENYKKKSHFGEINKLVFIILFSFLF